MEVYANAICYAGEFFDAEVGLYYLREDINPLSLNRYTYAHNNSLMFVDPTGHNADSILDINDFKSMNLLNNKKYGKSVAANTVVVGGIALLGVLLYK